MGFITRFLSVSYRFRNRKLYCFVFLLVGNKIIIYICNEKKKKIKK
ncbi:hypothetical protein BACSTE_00719 [Bacteroides stercoris ATCC 43183]|uniref:Uncharacterized protein n=1 Tax=Bacteroides stercoris ATCC 43183 TaxID=449673 RepID=B0NML0_BACSE|nr:hypothetical protein BACSTE_00719 [Bacteroides stercoris ATCC 43183]